MPRPRFARLPPERRAELLAIAARHFAEAGLAGASLNQILDEAGVSKGAAYYYFDDKGDLFATVVEDAWEQVTRRLWPEGLDLDGLFAGDFWAALEALYVRQVTLLAADPAVWRVAKSAPAVLADPSVARLAPRIEGLLVFVDGALRRAVAAGLIRDDLPPELLLAMVGALDGAIDGWFAEHPGAVTADPDLPRRTFAALRRMLEARHG